MKNLKGVVVFIAPVGIPLKRPRIKKLLSILNHKNVETEYWGWSRNRSELTEEVRCHNFRLILFGGGYRSVLTKIMYCLWPISIFLNLLIHRPKKIICLGLISAIPCYLYSLFFCCDYIFDDPDRETLLLPQTSWFKFFLKFFEIRTSRRSFAHVVPEILRYDYANSKMISVPNTPSLQLLKSAENFKLSKKDDQFVVYINGLLTEARGTEFIKQIILNTKDPSIKYFIASKGFNNSGAELFVLPNVVYLGELTQEKALAYYNIADLLITFYAPNIEINRYAAPNKWGDAFYYKVPIMCNSEVITVSDLAVAGCAKVIDYGDVKSALSVLYELANTGTTDLKKSFENPSLQQKYQLFENALEPTIHQFVTA